MVHIDDDDGMGIYIVNISSLPPLTLLKHYEWYMCGRMLNCHELSSPYELQQITHWSPLLVNHLGVGQRYSPIFIKMVVIYSHSNLRCINQSMLLIYCIFYKLSINISNILGHDVKPCDQKKLSS